MADGRQLGGRDVTSITAPGKLIGPLRCQRKDSVATLPLTETAVSTGTQTWEHTTTEVRLLNGSNSPAPRSVRDFQHWSVTAFTLHRWHQSVLRRERTIPARDTASHARKHLLDIRPAEKEFVTHRADTNVPDR